MGAKEFGALVERRMAELEISQNRLASRLGELEDGRIFDATQVRLIREGRRRLDHVLVAKLIDLLEMDPAEGWATAGLLPPGVDADMLRRLDMFAVVGASSVQGEPKNGPSWHHPGQRRWVERRRRDRRGLRLVPPLKPAA